MAINILPQAKSESMTLKFDAWLFPFLAATRGTEGDLTGMEYTVKMTDDSQIRLVSDQTQIHKGDCVAIEQPGDKANIRRVDKAQCE
jgi:hypothetical protein